MGHLQYGGHHGRVRKGMRQKKPNSFGLRKIISCFYRFSICIHKDPELSKMCEFDRKKPFQKFKVYVFSVDDYNLQLHRSL